jgi:hypothetical protein
MDALPTDARRIVESVIRQTVDHDLANGLRGVTKEQAMAASFALV